MTEQYQSPFLGDWGTAEDMKRDLWPGYSNNDTYNGELDGAEIIAAIYMTGSYDGSCRIMYRKDGKLYEIEYSHCSCYGLEGAWGYSAETTPDTLAMQVIHDYEWRDFTEYFLRVQAALGFTYKRK